MIYKKNEKELFNTMGEDKMKDEKRKKRMGGLMALLSKRRKMARNILKMCKGS